MNSGCQPLWNLPERIYNPRMSEYFKNSDAKSGEYNGLHNGLTSAQMAEPLNSPDANSNKRTKMEKTRGMETPSNVMCTAGGLVSQSRS